MPPSVEDRRRAVAAAFRAVAAEPTATAVVGAVESRLDALGGQLTEVLARLDSVETTLLESAWERPAAEPATEEPAETTPAVPAVPLNEGRMSSAASRALFGH